MFTARTAAAPSYQQQQQQQQPAAFQTQPLSSSSSASSTDAFLRDFTLVAEAAKRAQMAVLMRDFEGVGLS